MNLLIPRIFPLSLVLLSATLVAQSSSTFRDTVVAEHLYESGLKLQKRGQYDSAIVLFDSSAGLFEKGNMLGSKFRSLIKQAECLRIKSQYDKAFLIVRADSTVERQLLAEHPQIAIQRLIVIGSILRQQGKYDTTLIAGRNAFAAYQGSALNDPDLEWEIYTLLSGTFFNIGEHDSAFAYNDRALQLFPSPDDEQRLKISGTYNSIAGIHESRGNYRQALEGYTRSLEIRKAILGEQHSDISNIYNNIAAIHFRTGDNDLALEYYLKSLSIMTAIFEADHPSFGIRYNNIAMAYRARREFDKAVDFGIRSKTIFVKRLGANHPNVAGVVNNIGRTYSDMQQYSRALEAYREALSIWREKLGEKNPNVSQCYFNIGEAFGNLKQYDSALVWLERSLLHRRENLGERNVKTAQSYAGIAVIFAGRSDEDSALRYYQRSLLSLVEDFSDSSIFANPGTVRSISDIDLFSSLNGKAKMLFSRAEKKKSNDDLRLSLATFETALSTAENIRRGFGTEGSKLQLSQLTFNVYEDAIRCAAKLFERTKDRSFLASAFSIAERSKAGILSDAIAESNAKKFSGIPDSLLALESSLQIELTYTETQLLREKEKREKANAKKVAQFENSIFRIRRSYELLIADFEKKYPEYFSLKHRSGHVSLTELQRRLPKKTALLEYVLGDSTIFVFAVTSDDCSVITRPIGSSFAQEVKQFRLTIQNGESKEYAERAFSLYQSVLAPVMPKLKNIRTLLIVPDGIVTHLPFEALLTKKSSPKNAADFSSAPFLIKQFEISYRISASFASERSSDSSHRENSFLGIAPVFADRPAHSARMYSNLAERITRSRTVDGERFVELKESENEVRNISRLFNARKQTADLFLHSDADESILKSPNAAHYRFIHIASHGLINEKHPDLSAVIFASPGKGSREDGVLYSGEVYDLRLNADLVVLSACETGLGTIIKGEGLLGLTRGFTYAGANNLLVSLWQVADKSTAELMVKFYTGALKGESYSSALRSAKLGMIKEGKYAHPVEWSAFVLTGR